MSEYANIFPVSEVAVGTLRVDQVDVPTAIRSLAGPSVRVVGTGSRSSHVAQATGHALVHAVGLAFDHHLPLVLGPDEVWLAILQGHAAHPKPEPESQTRLQVRRDDFLHMVDPPWDEIVASFAQQMRSQVSAAEYDLYAEGFSTTGRVERAAFQISTMGAMQNRFRYEFISLCGIPEIRLAGTTDDWELLLLRAEELVSARVPWWWRELRRALGHFIDASQGRVDADAWRSLFKWNGESGGPYVDGWLNALIPYVYDGSTPRRNRWLLGERGKERGFADLETLETLPSSLSSAPVVWTTPSGLTDLLFVAGFVGAEQAMDGALRPAVGWGVLTVVGPGAEARHPSEYDPASSNVR